MLKLDKTDIHLLKLLQENSKSTNKQLSNRLNLSVTAVFERIKKLERSGVISKYVALVNKELVGKSFVVFCQIRLEQHSQEYVKKFEKEVVKLSEVSECYHISGDYDYLIKILVSDIQEFRSFMVNKLTSISHIGSTHSAFMISKVKHTTTVAID